MKEIFNYKGKEFHKVGYFGFSSVYEHGDSWIFVDEKGMVWHETNKPKEKLKIKKSFEWQLSQLHAALEQLKKAVINGAEKMIEIILLKRRKHE